MPEKDRETVTVEQIALTNMYQFEALLNVLEKKTYEKNFVDGNMEPRSGIKLCMITGLIRLV